MVCLIVAVSKKGWTDQELGLLWLKLVSEPQMSTRNVSGSPCLLILNGHNAHTMYQFCKYCTDHNIILVCLPSNSTHVLQQCDVSVFGPLASHWRCRVVQEQQHGMVITKDNFLHFYGEVRVFVFKELTMQASFKRTSIFLLNPEAIPEDAFAPALNTAAEHVPVLPNPPPHPYCIVCLDDGTFSAPTVRNPLDNVPTMSHTALPSLLPAPTDDMPKLPPVQIVGMPPIVPAMASHDALACSNSQLRTAMKACLRQMEHFCALAILRDKANARLQCQLYAKQKNRKLSKIWGDTQLLTLDAPARAAHQG